MTEERRGNLRSNGLEQIKQIVRDRLAETPSRVYLFGSWARGDQKRSSDVDVAVEFQTRDDANRRIVMNVRQALEDSTVPYKVDVIYLNEADDCIVSKVREEGILWNALLND